MPRFVTSVQHRLGVRFLETFLDPIPGGPINRYRKTAFQRAWQMARGCGWDLAGDPVVEVAKYEFLRYLAGEKEVLFHASDRVGLAWLEPRSPIAELLDRRWGLYATDDPFLAMARFVMKTPGEGYRGRYMEAFSVRGKPDRLGFVSLAKDLVPAAAAMRGALYVLPREPFVLNCRSHPQSHLSRQLYWLSGRAVQSDFESREWVCDRPVRPLASLPLTLSDLPCGVSWHERTESRLLAMMRYAWRKIPFPAALAPRAEAA